MMPIQKKLTALAVTTMVAAVIMSVLVMQFVASTHLHADDDDTHDCSWCLQLQQAKQFLYSAYVFTFHTGVFEHPAGIAGVRCAHLCLPAARSRSPPA